MSVRRKTPFGWVLPLAAGAVLTFFNGMLPERSELLRNLKSFDRPIPTQGEGLRAKATYGFRSC